MKRQSGDSTLGADAIDAGYLSVSSQEQDSVHDGQDDGFAETVPNANWDVDNPEVGRRDALGHDGIDERLTPEKMSPYCTSAIALDVDWSPVRPKDISPVSAGKSRVRHGEGSSNCHHRETEVEEDPGGDKQQNSTMKRLRRQLTSVTAMLTDDVMHLLCTAIKTATTATDVRSTKTRPLYRILDPLWLQADSSHPPAPLAVHTGDIFYIPVHHRRDCHWTLLKVDAGETYMQVTHYDSSKVGAKRRKETTDLLFTSWLLQLPDPKRSLESALHKVRVAGQGKDRETLTQI